MNMHKLYEYLMECHRTENYGPEYDKAHAEFKSLVDKALAALEAMEQPKPKKGITVVLHGVDMPYDFHTRVMWITQQLKHAGIPVDGYGRLTVKTGTLLVHRIIELNKNIYEWRP